MDGKRKLAKLVRVLEAHGLLDKYKTDIGYIRYQMRNELFRDLRKALGSRNQ